MRQIIQKIGYIIQFKGKHQTTLARRWSRKASVFGRAIS